MGIEFNNDQIYAIYDLENWWNKGMDQLFEISGGAGTGKALDVDTMIPTPNGDVRLDNLKMGDYVFGRDGRPIKIWGVYDQGKIDAYEFILADGRKCICNDEHLWNIIVDGEYRTVKTSEIIERIKTEKVYIPISSAVEYEEKLFEIDPYTFGKSLSQKRYGEDRSIPNEYFFGSIEQRWLLVQGIFDTFGGINNYGDVYITSIHEELIRDLRRLLSSLGVLYFNEKELLIDDVYIQSLVIKSNNFVKYKIFRNIHRIAVMEAIIHHKEFQKSDVKHFDRVEVLEVKDLKEQRRMKCIYVDSPEHLYLANDYIVTHNTTIIRYFIERMGLKFENCLFLAFMGKAASQMARNGLPAKTIHSGIYDFKEKIARDEEGHIIFTAKGKPKLIPTFELKDHLSKKIKLIVIDEASQPDEKMARDILSFGIPVIALGDLNQLPPVFGNSYFLREPNVILRQIMRQAEGNPIIWLSQQVLAGRPLKVGVYGNSAVIRKEDLTDFHFRSADIILTGTNKLRYNINNYCREEIKGIKRLEYPHLNEKVICRKNNWSACIDDNIFLTNGTTGFVENIYRESYNGKTMKMDFRPDYTKKSFKNVTFDYKHMYARPGVEEDENPLGYFYDKMEYAYAITVHSSQGSQYDNVLFLYEDFMNDPEDRKRLLYTGITRGINSDTIVI